MNIDRFKNQHREIEALANKLGQLLPKADQEAGAREARDILVALSGKLSMHLLNEDKFLYPQAAKSKDSNVRQLAARFAQEMGGLSKAFKEFMGTYPTAKSIQENAAGFQKSARGVLSALGQRVKQEELKFYPVLEQAA